MNRRPLWAWVGALSLLAVGCIATFMPPAVDQVYFSPLATDERTIDEVKLKWLVRKDGHAFCSRITGVPITPISMPMACAYWNVVRKECTIVTPFDTGFNYVGHELRHCFEGAFGG
jgi:hypothetical protein